MAVCYFFLLGALGLAFTAQAQDCTRPVPEPNTSLTDKDILLQQFPDGTKVKFMCGTGYFQVSGSTESTCTAGSWSPVSLQCQIKSCGSLEALLNGQTDYSEGIDFGATVSITCDTGYSLVGRDKIRCGDQGWMDRLPTCHVITCDPPPPILHGTFEPEKDSYQYGEVITYDCQNEYAPNGTASVECSEDGKLTPKPPTCVYVNCVNPDIKHAVFKGGSRPPHRYKNTLTHECKSGYKMIGERTSECDINSKWSPELLKCEPEDCTKPPGREGMTLKEKELVLFKHDTSVTFLCDEGYESAGGSGVITCTTGTWSKLTLTCKRIRKPPTTKTPDGSVANGDDDKPGNGGNVVAKALGGLFSCLAVIGLIVAGVFFGNRKKGSGNPANEIAKDTEEPILLQNKA